MLRLGLYCLLATVLLACQGENSSETQSLEKTTRRVTGSSAETAQKAPANQFELYLNDFQFYNGHRAGQLQAHCYCTELNDKLTQCILFEGNRKNARLMGLEYIISEDGFKTLPEDEKKLWHSFRYGVKSGLVVAPGLSPQAEHDLMSRLVTAYGKTWQTWHVDQDSILPLGSPALMMGFTKDDQLDPALLQSRDRELTISSAEKRTQRTDILARPTLSGADSWQTGPAVQLPGLTRRKYPYLQKDSLR